jgi:stearoyl-CoA desaturase (delta-9 desaturase)
MYKIGLAWDLDRTAPVRIEAKVQETSSYLIEKRKHTLHTMQDKVDQLLENLCLKIKELEESSISIKEQFKKSFMEIQDSLKSLAEQLHSSPQIAEKPSEKLLKMVNRKISATEQAIYKLYNKLNAVQAL